ncbi:TPM domain-containing protein [Paenibacillus sp. 19GGS1-52]|uniref:TPM domain-containing protein n=1 Tax=Paenibacillus sp. 19GGS1-52 TaxID=2758563 RepID=UPI001EFB4690|nr:TPM domain-containing protein [Paenibacillus sp. 19GGS1-52]ULO07271.1 TPM domain-containing protein [Paenibacillus sp. 19GGS1-52]
MKKYIALFLLLNLLWIPGVYAIGAPTQQGLVTDEAGLFSTAEVASIEKMATTDLFTFHLLTVDSLNGTASNEYASDVYDAWGLSTRDILLLISAGDQKIELHFDNPGLQTSVNSWSQRQGGSTGSAAITELLDTYFIPYAKDGDFAGGVSSLIKAIPSIVSSPDTGSASGSQGSSNAVGSSDSGTATGSTAGTVNSGTTAPVNNSSSGLSMLTLTAIAIGGVLLLLVLFVVLTGLRRRKQLSEQQEKLSDLLVRASQALETLKPFQGIVQGKTGEMVEAISKRLSDQLIQISALQSKGKDSLPSLYQLSALKAAREQLQQTELSFQSAIEAEEKNIAVISEADRNVKQRITELKKDAPEIDEQLQSTVKETGFALQEIIEDIKELTEETAKADQLELFDPIAAQEVTEDAQELQEKIERDLQDVDTYEDKVNEFPGVLSAARTKIAGIIEQHSLQNMKVKSYDSLELANAEATALEEPLRSGDMDEVRKIAARLDSFLNEAIAMTERQALLRQNNRRDLETVRSHWSQLKQQRDGLQSRIAEARDYFVEQHITSLEEVLEEWSRRLREGATEVPQLETWTSDERGEYDKARSGLDQLLSMQDEAGQQFTNLTRSLEELQERLNKVTRLFSEGQIRVDTAQQMLHSRGLTSRTRFQLSLLPEYAELEQRLSARPANLDELEALSQSFTVQIDSFVDEVSRLVRQQEEEERQAQLALMRERQRKEQARKRMSSGPPSSGGFGGGGGRSSGGSSWGGSSGRSSGGSSWGGGGGKSGGRSSGGSKW